MVHDRAELAAQLDDYPAQETILVEQMITGQEYSVESLTQDGKTLFSSVTRKETTDVDSQYFVEMAHTVPAPRDDAWDAVQRANDRDARPAGRRERHHARRVEARRAGGGPPHGGRRPDSRRRDHGAVPTRDGPADGARDPADRARRARRLSRGPALRTPGVRRAPARDARRCRGRLARRRGPMGQRRQSLARHPRRWPPMPRRRCAPSSSTRPSARSWVPSAAPTTGPSPSSSTRPTIAELDEIEERVRRAVTIHTTPLLRPN